jgi:hypothetical protein
MATGRNEESKDANRDPITGAPGSHPVGTGLGAAAGGMAAGAAAGSVAGPAGGLLSKEESSPRVSSSLAKRVGAQQWVPAGVIAASPPGGNCRA